MVLYYVDDGLKKDREIVLAAVKSYGFALEYADAGLKKDREIVLAAVKSDRRALEYADSELQKDIDFLYEFFKSYYLNGNKINMLYLDSPCLVHTDAPRLYISRIEAILDKENMPYISVTDLYNPEKRTLLEDPKGIVFLHLCIDDINSDLNQVLESGRWEYEPGKLIILSDSIRIIIVGDPKNPRFSADLRSRIVYVASNIIELSCKEETDNDVSLDVEKVVDLKISNDMQGYSAITSPLALAKMNFLTPMNIEGSLERVGNVVVESKEEVSDLDLRQHSIFLCSTITSRIDCLSMYDIPKFSIFLFPGLYNVENHIEESLNKLCSKTEDITFVLPKDKCPYLYTYVYNKDETWYCRLSNSTFKIKDVCFYDLDKCKLSDFSAENSHTFFQKQSRKN